MDIRKRCRQSIWIVAVLFCLLISLSSCGKRQDKIIEIYMEAVDRADIPEHGKLRFALGFLDDDAIPDLFVGCGTGGVDGIYVFRYDNSDKNVTCMGSFSSRGRISYCEKKGILLSEYGNQGFFEHVYEQVLGQRVEFVAAHTAYLTEEGTRYYFTNNSPDERGLTAYEVSESEYEQRMTPLYDAYPVMTEIYYDEMLPLNWENMREMYKTIQR